jgi:dTDP-4-dehydrorhamnose reductase
LAFGVPGVRFVGKIVLFGGYGLLGQSLYPELVARGHEVSRQGRNSDADIQLDPYDSKSIGKLITSLKPDLVVNLNALTDVDYCESHKSEAFLANTRTVELLGENVSGSRSKFLHISTDQVYTSSGFQEEVDALPSNIYSLTKYAGELAAVKCGGIILRTNFLVGHMGGTGTGLANWLYRSISDKRAINVFEDSMFNPVHPSYLARLICEFLGLDACGVYNVGSTDGISKAGLARAICKKLNLDDSNLRSSKISDHQFIAERPLDMRMNISRLADIVAEPSPTIDETIDRVCSDLLT